jgi:hypothetical protein
MKSTQWSIIQFTSVALFDHGSTAFKGCKTWVKSIIEEGLQKNHSKFIFLEKKKMKEALNK